MQQPISTILTTAPLRNVAAFSALMERVMTRGANLPGMAAFYGRSGLGKSMSATYAANKHKAYYVQVKSVWTRKRLCQAILNEMGIVPAKTVSDLVDQIGEQLALSRRPLIVDEADFLVKRDMIEIVRDLYESSFAPVALIGEENLPNNLKRYERVHNRILDWTAAQPCDEADTRQLAAIYCPGVNVADDLLKKVCDAVNGCARRICVNLDHIREYALSKSLPEIDAAMYRGRIDTGSPAKV